MLDMISSTKLDKLRADANWVYKALESRAYIDKPILYPSLNWSDFINEETDPGNATRHLTKKIYENDKLLISTIKELVTTIDTYRYHQKLSNESFSAKSKTILELELKVQDLEKKLYTVEHRSRDKIIDQNTKIRELSQLQKVNKRQSDQIKDLITVIKDYKVKHRVAIRKKDLEISALKNKIIDKRNMLSSTVEYEIPLTPSLQQNFGVDYGGASSFVNGGLGNSALFRLQEEAAEGVFGKTVSNFFNHNEILSADEDTSNQRKHMVDVENQMFTQSLMLTIESIASENYKLSNFVQCLKEYMESVNREMMGLNNMDNAVDVQITNPSDAINFDRINKVDRTTMLKYFGEINNSEAVERPLMNELYKLYHHIEELIESSSSPRLHQSSNKMIERLKQDYKVMEKNWKDALKTSEQWKRLAKLNSG